MKIGVAIELAIERKDANAIRGSVVMAITREHEPPDVDVLRGLIYSFLQHMDHKALAAWYEFEQGEGNIDTGHWVRAWQATGLEQ